MLHLPEWLVIICILLPVVTMLVRSLKGNRK